MVAVYLTSMNSEISYLYYNIVGCGVVVIVGYLISLTSGENQPIPSNMC